MSSMQNFLSWIKAKSKKAKTQSGRDQVYAAVPHDEEEEGAFLHAGSRDSACRASMKLPPIPRGELACQLLANRRPHVPMMGVASLRTESPAHIYEEIPNHMVVESPPETFNSGTDPVNVTNLDFAQAKDFGSFVVVPIRSHISNSDANDEFSVEPNNNKGDSTVLQACDIPETSMCHPDSDQAFEATRCGHPAGSCSSGDSGVADLSHDHHSDFFSHCSRCRRPHGIFNGISLSHLGGELDPESLELQTYFNNQMLRQQEQEPQESQGGRFVERFLIVPSLSPLTEERSDDARDECALGLRQEDLADSEVPKLESAQGSDSNDTCNEYDLRSSDRSSTSQSRPGSYAFDSGSSLYAFSNSEKEAALLSSSSSSSGVVGPQAPRHKPQESDSSNDTFSEYDMHTSPEYEYYLSKAQHNLWLKKDVMRVIRESESSEYETTSDVTSPRCSCSDAKHPDNISLTTVTSLSDLSLSDKDGSSDHGRQVKPLSAQDDSKTPCDCQQQQVKLNRHRTKTKTKHSGRVRTERRHAKCQSSTETSGSDVPAWERSDKKGAGHSHHHHHHHKHNNAGRRKTTAKKAAELYCLPDFSQGAAGNSAVEEPERLSCRATDFTPPVHSTSNTPRTQISQQYATRQVPAAESQHRLQPRRAPQQNRMLSDLMKLNHDRLLVLF